MNNFTSTLVLLLSTCSLFYKAESKLTCYHCTKQITTDGSGKNTTTYFEYHTTTSIKECAKKECSDDAKECYSLTTAASKTEKTSSEWMSCGTKTKAQVCDAVGGLKVATCKSDYTWKTCTKNLCNGGDSDDNGSGSSLKPMLFLTIFTVTVAMISHF